MAPFRNTYAPARNSGGWDQALGHAADVTNSIAQTMLRTMKTPEEKALMGAQMDNYSANSELNRAKAQEAALAVARANSAPETIANAMFPGRGKAVMNYQTSGNWGPDQDIMAVGNMPAAMVPEPRPAAIDPTRLEEYSRIIQGLAIDAATGAKTRPDQLMPIAGVLATQATKGNQAAVAQGYATNPNSKPFDNSAHGPYNPLTGELKDSRLYNATTAERSTQATANTALANQRTAESELVTVPDVAVPVLRKNIASVLGAQIGADSREAVAATKARAAGAKVTNVDKNDLTLLRTGLLSRLGAVGATPKNIADYFENPADFGAAEQAMIAEFQRNNGDINGAISAAMRGFPGGFKKADTVIGSMVGGNTKIPRFVNPNQQPTAPAGQPVSSAGGAVVSVRSAQEAQALPPGTVYVTPEGRKFTR
jgi:hypothetical protein